MNTPLSRVEDLFVRYWDDALGPEEMSELAELLTNSPAALDWFQFLSAHAVVAAELPAVPLLALGAERRSADGCPGESGQWSRRKVLGLLGGMAAGISALAFGRAFWRGRDGRDGTAEEYTQVRVVAVQGAATVRAEDGRTISPAEAVPTGAIVSTQGIGSAATLLYPDGSTVALLDDAALTIHESGRLLQLHRGMASAELRPRANDQRLTLTTALLSLSHVSNASMIVGQGSRSAEIEVRQGAVAVSAPTGEPMAVVRQGELLTVGSNGVRTQEPIPSTPEEFSWNLAGPLPVGWLVGRREVVGGTPVVCCEAWPDPYYNGTVMYQIRSDKQWARGLFRLSEGSGIHVRYRAKRNSPRGQVCFCVRTEQSWCCETGMLEYNGGFDSTAGEWRWLHITAGSMLVNKHPPAFGAPWVGFLVIFNTFEVDIGLEVAEFRVTLPGH